MFPFQIGAWPVEQSNSTIFKWLTKFVFWPLETYRGRFVTTHRSPHPAECKADHKSSSHGIPQVRGCGTSLTPPDRSAWVIFRNLAHAGTADQKNREWIGTAHNGLAFI